jgi:hypothetical protein
MAEGEARLKPSQAAERPGLGVRQVEAGGTLPRGWRGGPRVGQAWPRTRAYAKSVSNSMVFNGSLSIQ